MAAVLGLLDPEGEGTMILENVGSYILNDRLQFLVRFYLSVCTSWCNVILYCYQIVKNI